MKLSEALLNRADYQKRIGLLKQRILNNAKVQEGDEPAEAVPPLLEQMDQLADELRTLMQRINKTNLHTEFAPGMTLTDALAARDVLALRRNIYQELVNVTTIRQDRYSRQEIRYQTTVNVGEIQRQTDRLAKEYRELDLKIQEVNWRTELLD